MFKLESYIAPFIMGYIDQYVQLKKEDLQISLWGGDAVLNKLDLRLDAIESAVQLPITFKSGHIHELRIHVPWTNFSSESVIITINTIECVVKLRDATSSEDDRSSASSSTKVHTPPKRKEREQHSEEEELPAGYLQGYINKILNNVNIVVNNLILKFVEDDIVLSVNVKSAELYSANADWMRAFVELELPQLFLRRVINIHDLTVCLDKRNASGKIETYQDPLMYRCSLTCRLYTAYDSLHAKYPSTTRLNVLCEKLDISLTDTQVPMFFRLIELCLAIYYHALDTATQDADTGQKRASDIRKQIADETSNLDSQSDQGWGSWAWSYVPALLGEDEDDDDYVTYGDGVNKRRQRGPPVLSIGAYCRKASFTFKLSEISKGSSKYSTSKTSFKPCVLWEIEGIGVDLVRRGEEFFSAQVGFSNTRMYCEGVAICGVLDTADSYRDTCFLRCGQVAQEKGLHFFSNSLFDDTSPENQGSRAEFVTSGATHAEVYTENWALNKYTAISLDYCYCMERTDTAVPSDANVSSEGGPAGAQETSNLRVVCGPAFIAVNSSMVQRLHKFAYCVSDNEYQPYLKKTSAESGEDLGRAPPSEEEVRHLEEFIASQTMHFTMLKPHVCFYTNDLPPYDVTTKRTTKRHAKTNKGAGGDSAQDCSPGAHEPLAGLLAQAERLDVQYSTCMYPRHVVRVASASTSSTLLHHAHSHTHFKVFGLQLGLTSIGEKGRLSPVQSLLQPWSGACYTRNLLLQAYWKNPLQPREETLYEVPQLCIHVTKPQLCLLAHLLNSWLLPAHAHQRLNRTTLMQHVFSQPGEANSGFPVLEVIVSNCELKLCNTEATRSFSATITSLQVMLIKPVKGQAVITPLLYGPVDNSHLHSREFFTSTSLLQSECDQDVLMCTVQLPTHSNTPTAPGALLLEVQGIVATFDPVLYEWLCYGPIINEDTAGAADQTNESNGHAIDAALADAAHPLRGGDSHTESNMTNPTNSITKTPTQSQTRSKSVPMTDPPVITRHPPEPEPAAEPRPPRTWGAVCADWFPVLQTLHVQVDIQPCCVFFPRSPVTLAEPTMNIALNMKQLFCASALPDCVLVCSPRALISSAGHTRIVPLQDLPIKTMEQALAAEKLPWNMKLKNASVLTLTPAQQPLYILHPCHVASTLAITCTYDPPASQHISALAACVHCDSEPVTLALSHLQVELLYAVAGQLYEGGLKCWESYELVQELSVKDDDKSVAMDTAPLATAPVVMSKEMAAQSSCSPNDGFDPMALEIEGIPTETLESESMISRDSPVDAGGVRMNVKLSLWLQGTLPKLTAKLYSIGKEGGVDGVVRLYLEDASASLDMHAVYTKLISKLGAVTLTHATRRHGSTEAWQPGNFQSLLFTSADDITRNTHVISHKYGRQRSGMRASESEQYGGVPGHSDKEHTFLTVTFTRALKKNVKKKLKLADASAMLFGTSLNSESTGCHYLNELCVNIQSCDVILNCPVLLQICQVFLIDDLNASNLEAKTTESDIPHRASSELPLITADLLPLLYVNTSRIRLFMPKIATFGYSTSVEGNDIDTKIAGEGTKPFHDIACETKETLHYVGDNFIPENVTDDVFLCELIGLSIIPQADNPLPRLVVDKAIYKSALQAGMTSYPGSEVEDRQYQLDILGWNLATGRWFELERMKKIKDAEETQNPALEWNNKTTKGHCDMVELVPVASSFDLRIIIAPAVTFTPPAIAAPTNQKVVVCGHSLEVNATSDLDFFVSLEQLQLAEQIFQTNFKKLFCLVTPSDSLTAEETSVDEQSAAFSKTSTGILDSGVESDVSLLHGHQGQPDIMETISEHRAQSPVKSTDSKLKQTNIANYREPLKFTSFNVLLTAGRISMSLYKFMRDVKQGGPRHEPKRKADLEAPATDKRRSGRRRRERSGTEESSTLDSGHVDGEVPILRKLVPILYMFFSQPHSLLSMEPHAQKIELSCYDLVLKGAIPGSGVIDAGRFIPEPCDYTVHWIDTKPGQPNPKTGIPPSLYTFRVIDFLHKPVSATMNIERPLRLNFSLDKLEQIQSLINDSLLLFSISAPTKEATQSRQDQKSASYEKQVETIVSLLGNIESVALNTVQLVVGVETVACPEQPQLQMSFQAIRAFLHITPDDDQPGRLEAVHTTLNLENALLKTSVFECARPLIGPFSCDVSCDALWLRHSGSPSLPQVNFLFESGVLPVQVGQAHIVCMKLLTAHFNNFFQPHKTEGVAESGKNPMPVERDGPKGTSVSRRDVASAHESEDHSVDDLRSGLLSYVDVETSIDELPNEGEVLFSNDFSCGQAAVTWCYGESRVLTHVTCTQLPVNLPAHLHHLHTDETLQVPCSLQLWDCLSRKFKDFAEFNLSEHLPCDVKLWDFTEKTSSHVTTSRVWRALIGRPVSKEFKKLSTKKNDRGTAFIEPLVSPLTLAASLQVSSCFSRQSVPQLQARVALDRVQLHLVNNHALLGASTPRQLQPYVLHEPATDQHVLTVTMDTPLLTARYFEGREQTAEAQVSAKLMADVVEYRNLTTMSLVDAFDLDLSARWLKVKQKATRMSSKLWLDPVEVHVSPSIVHTLVTTALFWQQLARGMSGEAVIGEHNLICNDTQDSVVVKQASSDASRDHTLIIPSRACLPFSWITHKQPQMLCVGLERLPGLWTQSLSLDEECVVERTLVPKQGETVPLIIHVRQLSSTQRQVLISGCLVVSSQVTQTLDVKLITSCPQRCDQVLALSPCASLPSFALSPRHARSLKVRLGGQKVLWSQELSLTATGEGKPEQAKLIKIPSQDSVTLIHVWCQIFRQNIGSLQQTHVVLMPLFVLRCQLPAPLLVSMETPRLKSAKQLELVGCGTETQLHTLSGDLTHHFSFQLSDNLKPSKPSIQLNADMIEQVRKQPLRDVTTLISSGADGAAKWPYNQLGASKSKTPDTASMRPTLSSNLQEVSLTSNTPPGVTAKKPPNIDLQVTLSQWKPGAKTLLVDIAPYLLFCNEINLDIWVIADGESHWKLPAQQKWAPPLFQGPFRLGLVVDNELQLSQECSLSAEDNEARYLPSLPGLLYLHGHVRVTLPIKTDGVLTQVCYLSLQSTMHHNMRVVTIRQAYSMTSSLPYDLHVLTYNVPLSSTRVSADLTKSTEPEDIPGDSACSSHALLFWQVVQEPSDKSKHDESDLFNTQTSETLPELVNYLIFRKIAQSGNNTLSKIGVDCSTVNDHNHLAWSTPLRVKLGDSRGSRQNVALPTLTDEGSGDSALLCISAVQEQSITYLSVTADTQPQIHVHNHTPCALHFGQAYTYTNRPDVRVYEEVELLSGLPLLLQYGSAQYTCPTLNSRYPQHTQQDSSDYKLHLALCLHSTNACTAQQSAGQSVSDPCCHMTERLFWSQVVSLGADSQYCISVPGMSDIKVHCQRSANTTHVYLDPVSRAEISAKEVRRRIKGMEQLIVEPDSGMKLNVSLPNIGNAKQEVNSTLYETSTSMDAGWDVSIVRENKDIASNVTFPRRKRNVSERYAEREEATVELSCSLVCSRISLVLVNEESTSKSAIQYRECVRITADNCAVTVYPHTLNIAQLTAFRRVQLYGTCVMIGALQVDNQLQGKYDFPVLLYHSKEVSAPRLDRDFQQLLLADQLDLMRNRGFLGLEFTLCSDPSSGITLQQIIARVKPVQLFVEDVYVYDIMKAFAELVPIPLTSTEHDKQRDVPLDVQISLAQFNQPIRLQRLLIQPINMDLSVHASLKLFIASDHSPLKFAQFEKNDVFISSSQLIRDITMHFASGAIFRAGLVVGSLELLGNPTGLVRSVGAGVRDLVSLPYQGLTRGPTAFLTGLSNGIASFGRNVSTGTLTSISNLASSVSRNMDVLSLDAEHEQRQAATRHRRPEGLSQGLRNGLTGFGLSLLGAVAGLADQPLQTLTRPSPTPEASPSPTQRATGLVSGVGKGLVGAMTKPLGGAAELVSQTSLGLLQGTGLARYPRPRVQAEIKRAERLCNSPLKISRYVLDPRLSGEVAYILSSHLYLHSDNESCPVRYDVILTQRCLGIVHTGEDTQQQLFSLAEVQCHKSDGDDTVLYITVQAPSKSQKKEIKGHARVNSRVQAFVQQHVSWQHPPEELSLPPESPIPDIQESGPIRNVSSPNSEVEEGKPKRAAFNYKLHVDSWEGQLFLHCFTLLKQRETLQGFTI